MLVASNNSLNLWIRTLAPWCKVTKDKGKECWTRIIVRWEEASNRRLKWTLGSSHSLTWWIWASKTWCTTSKTKWDRCRCNRWASTKVWWVVWDSKTLLSQGSSHNSTICNSQAIWWIRWTRASNRTNSPTSALWDEKNTKKFHRIDLNCLKSQFGKWDRV